jgi:phosphoribosylanthranilate isomerase
VLAAHLAGNQPNPQLEDYYALIDAFIIDSYNKEKGQIGGTGNVHDWNVTKKIVADCPLPIFLAGGLNPDNVENAISIVNPYGVDANSGLRGEDGGRSFDRCKHFVRNAKMAKFSTRNDEA